MNYLMFRENIQECEAIIFLGRLALEKPPRLGPEAVAKYKAMLVSRLRGWTHERDQLFEAAAEAAKAIGSDSSDKPAAKP